MSSGKYRPPRWKNQNQKRYEKFDSSIDLSSSSELESDAAAKAKARRERFSKPAVKSDDYGLVSRGEDDRLRTDIKAREEYFKKIQLRSIKVFEKEYLEDILHNIDKEVYNMYIKDKSIVVMKEPDSEDSILMSLRKLREALLPLKPNEFTKKVFLYSVKIAVLVGNYQAFLPSILYLLDTIHPIIPLDDKEFHLIVCLYAYHTSHFNNDINSAYKILYKYIPNDKRPWNVLRSLATNNYVQWNRYKQTEPDFWLKLSMNQHHHTISTKSIQTIGKSYITLTKSSLEQLTGQSWTYISTKLNCGWTISTDTSIITIRQRKK